LPWEIQTVHSSLLNPEEEGSRSFKTSVTMYQSTRNIPEH